MRSPARVSGRVPPPSPGTAGWLRAAYARHAPHYDADFLDQQRPKILALAAAAPPEPGRAVDLGAGTGLVGRLTGRAFAAPGHPCSWVAVDFCAAMLAQAEGLRVEADLAALPFADGIFAEAWCVTALIGAGAAARPLAEVARVLRPGGLLRLSVLRHEVGADFEAGLAAAGLVVTDRLDLGIDRGWIARRLAADDVSVKTPAPAPGAADSAQGGPR